DGAVINHHALFIAPAAIDHLPRLHLMNVARDHAVHQLGSVFAGNQVLVERHDIDERSRIADSVVLVLVVHLIGADGVIARPFAIIQALAQGKSALMKCGSDGHGKSISLRLIFSPRRYGDTEETRRVTIL